MIAFLRHNEPETSCKYSYYVAQSKLQVFREAGASHTELRYSMITDLSPAAI
jgi:hypothetical protein